jgi:hypothetical protein
VIDIEIDGDLYHVEGYYEKAEPENNVPENYTIYEIDGHDIDIFKDEFLDKIINELKKRRSEWKE